MLYLGVAALILGAVITYLVMRPNKQADSAQMSNLKNTQQQLEDSIAASKAKLNEKPPEQTPEQIDDYWNKK
jgi:hypothetical protein